MTKPLFIDQQEQLDNWCKEQLSSISLLALDTEFLRVRTYFPILCLIQLATDNGSLVCVDPLAIKDFTSLNQLLEAAHILKILHSSRQDIEALVHTLNVLPNPVYDTQLALEILGIYDHPLSYQSMVEVYENVFLSKEYTRTEWDRRPLMPKQIEYAYDDVRYLIPCYRKIHTQIKEKKLDEALIKHFLALQDRSRYEPNSENIWKNVKGKSRLNRHAKKLLKELAKNRELLAIKKDMPRGWVLKDKSLIDIAFRFSIAKNWDALESHEVTSNLSEELRVMVLESIDHYRSEINKDEKSEPEQEEQRE